VHTLAVSARSKHTGAVIANPLDAKPA
jgi:hypothetical protein